jgi:hypothetical protein
MGGIATPPLWAPVGDRVTTGERGRASGYPASTVEVEAKSLETKKSHASVPLSGPLFLFNH